MKNPMKSWRRIPMKKRPTETIHVLAETPISPEGEAVAVPTVPTKYERLPLLAICVYIFLGLSLILYAIGLASPTFADFFNRYISSAVRATTATLTGWIPFSLAETLLLFLPVIVVSLVVYAVRFPPASASLSASLVTLPFCLTPKRILLTTSGLLR